MSPAEHIEQRDRLLSEGKDQQALDFAARTA